MDAASGHRLSLNLSIPDNHISHWNPLCRNDGTVKVRKSMAMDATLDITLQGGLLLSLAAQTAR